MTKTSAKNKVTKKRMQEFRGKILAWYDLNARVLPWRYRFGEKPDPYRVWLSEIMLQQTTVSAVIPYFSKFLEKWPDVQALARAPRDEVMEAWAGLGYYSRARNLHACAIKICTEYGGHFPDDTKALKSLPGIGDYTSAAVAAIAFNRPETVVDGNIERVAARYFAFKGLMPAEKRAVRSLAENFFKDEHERPGDLAQALMDLGAGICIPAKPRCGLCPVSESCAAFQAGLEEVLPLRQAKKNNPYKLGNAYWIENSAGHLLVQRRPEKGIMAGMLGLPTTEWCIRNAGAEPPAHPQWLEKSLSLAAVPGGKISHSFTHFDLDLFVYRGIFRGDLNFDALKGVDGFYWTRQEKDLVSAMPTLFQKVAKIAKT